MTDEPVYTLAQIRSGTGWPPDARFVLAPGTHEAQQQPRLGTPVMVWDGDMITIEWSGQPVTVVVCCNTPVTLRDLTEAEADDLLKDRP